MAYTIYAGQRVTAVVEIANVGGAPGTFVLTGEILYKSGAHAGWFFPTPTDYCDTTPPAGAHQLRRSLAPGQRATVEMYKVNWACGKDAAFGDGELFDVVWTLTCLETGQSVTRRDYNKLQHRCRAVPQPPPPPGAPYKVSSTAYSPTNADLVIGWAAVPGATSYKLWHKGEGFVAETTGTQVRISGLYPDAPYTCAVAACNQAGCSALGPEAVLRTAAYSPPPSQPQPAPTPSPPPPTDCSKYRGYPPWLIPPECWDYFFGSKLTGRRW